MIKLYTGFCLVAIASAIVALGRLALGHNPQDVIPPNVVISGVCLAVMMGLIYRERRTRKITNGT